ncbi:hypothetical protein GCM10010106_28050 [Thermopolyspora flexuosa]|nr:hypothetical protein GCM10010106_28050 [Thermopolyspora flexuosa]
MDCGAVPYAEPHVETKRPRGRDRSASSCVPVARAAVASRARARRQRARKAGDQAGQRATLPAGAQSSVLLAVTVVPASRTAPLTKSL